MRILSITAYYHPFLEFGGPPVKVKALAEGLARQGHEVTVITADWGLEKCRGGELAGELRKSCFGYEYEKDGVRAVYLPTKLRYRTLSWNPAIHRFCRSELRSFDLVHIFGLYDLLGIAVGQHCCTIGKPYVVEPIGMFRPIVRNLRAKRLYHVLWGGKLLANAAALIATSEQEAQELRQGGLEPAKIVLRRNGVEVPASLPERGEFRRKFGIDESTKLVLFLGRLSRKKSPDLLLNAFGRATREVLGDAKLVYAGPDSEQLQASLQKQASQLGVADQVLFTGPVYGDEKWMAYRDADVFVLPSQNENFGNSAAEAMACGVPTVVTENCGIASLTRGVALVVRHDVAELADALRRFLADSELQRKLGAASAQFASKLAWQEPVEQMEALYARLAVRGNASAE
jgi:glycosyltransferase involved in cell wall biosynthesis